MTDLDTRDVLRRVVADEPDFAYDLDAVVTRGRATRRRHRARVGSLATVGVCAVAGAAFVLAPDADRRYVSGAHGRHPRAAVATRRTCPRPRPTTSTARRRPSAARPTNAFDRKIAAAVVAASPEDWFLDLHNGESSSGGVDGTADDGDGPGSISVGISTGSQQLHPCNDAEFVAGATCTERTLASGAVLSQRGLARQDGLESVVVVLTYPDGSGINADATDAIWVIDKTRDPPAHGAGADKPGLVLSRIGPTYTVHQLTEVVLAVDAALN